jgi:RHS repeat-associated protein
VLGGFRSHLPRINAALHSVDEPLAADDGTALTYLHADALGSVVRATNNAGVVTLTRAYDVWGRMEAGATESGRAFSGREWDPESGLYYYRARYYDSNSGLFISEDPLRFRGGSNFYGYVRNNPAAYSDPTGLLTCVTWGDGTKTCVNDPSLCLRMGWCTPPATPACASYYGNWGGGGWTGGQCGSWNTIDHTRAKSPIDMQDLAYCYHDKCYGACATLSTTWQRLECRTRCDYALSGDLTRTVFGGGGNLHALGAIALMSNAGGAVWTTLTSDETSPASPQGKCCGGSGSGGGGK